MEPHVILLQVDFFDCSRIIFFLRPINDILILGQQLTKMYLFLFPKVDGLSKVFSLQFSVHYLPCLIEKQKIKINRKKMNEFFMDY